MNTSAMVTSICGSSSRGVTSVAKTPSNSATSASSGVICELAKKRAMRPETPIAYLPAAARLDLDGRFHRVENDTLASLQPGQHFDLAGRHRFAEAQLAQGQHPLLDSAHKPQRPRHAGRRRPAARSACLARPMTKCTRACMPGTTSAIPAGR
ncbi:MAG: hypothetical protein V5B30_16300 [Candidatus Accumulibacter delftensis]